MKSRRKDIDQSVTKQNIAAKKAAMRASRQAPVDRKSKLFKIGYKPSETAIKIGPDEYIEQDVLIEIERQSVRGYGYGRKKRNQEEPNVTSEARKIADQLENNYSVKVKLLKTDDDFYSEKNNEVSVADGVYFVSEENPESTARITDLLIRRTVRLEKSYADKSKENKLSYLDTAHERKTEIAIQTAQELAPHIAECSNRYRAENNGKEPSLHKLADLLNQGKVPTPGGKESKWYAQTVKRVMATEKAGHQK